MLIVAEAKETANERRHGPLKDALLQYWEPDIRTQPSSLGYTREVRRMHTEEM